MPLNQQLLNILACPDCKNPVKYTKRGRKESLKCIKCKRVFQVKNSIPIMLPKTSK